MAEQVAAGLEWSDEPGGAVLGVRRGTPGLATPVARIRVHEGRLDVDLLFLAGGRAVDVTVSPGAVVEVLTSHARRARRDPNGWLDALATRLQRRAEAWGTWSPAGGDTGFVAVLGGMTHPVLGAAYDAGADPVSDIPRWATGPLRADTVVAAARRLYAGRATRPVVRGLAACLSPAGERAHLRHSIAWWPIALAAAGRDVLEPDRLAAVLAAGRRVEGPPPDRQDLDTVERGLALLGAPAAARVLGDALTGPEHPRRLVEVLRVLGQVQHHLAWPPPPRLDELAAACLRVAALDPDPAGHDRPPRPGRPPEWAVPRHAPEVEHPRVTHRYRYPTAVGHLDGQVLGPLTLVLPRTPEELVSWGELLANCLADYRPAVAAGRSVVIGVREHDALVAALEMRSAERRLVQFLGVRNRPPAPAVSAPVIEHLVQLGLIRGPGTAAVGARA